MEAEANRLILERISNEMAARNKAAGGGASSQAMSAIDVLRAIVEEVAGPGRPFSADSYLPPYLIHDARQAIEAHEREQEAK